MRAHLPTRKAAGALAGVVLAGVLTAACSLGGGGSASPPPPTVRPAGGSASTTTTRPPVGTTATTLPQCGAPRDPLDPTNAGPPAGSPANC